MEYPAFVFRAPGSYSGPRGSCYGLRQVVNADDHADALAHGWFDTPEAAVAAAGADAYTHGLQGAKLAAVLREQPWLDDAQPEPEPEEDAPPTREEMLAKAQQLGLRVDKRWSDETLLAKIAVALAAAATPAPAPPADDDPI